MSDISMVRCVRCGDLKPESDLNGIDPLAKGADKYSKAYCQKLSQCNSEQTKNTLGRLKGLA
jgi:hypothetical protein